MTDEERDLILGDLKENLPRAVVEDLKEKLGEDPARWEGAVLAVTGIEYVLREVAALFHQTGRDLNTSMLAALATLVAAIEAFQKDPIANTAFQRLREMEST